MAPSAVWIYCTKIDDGTKVRCNKCEKVFKFNKSTSTLLTHLRAIHKIDVPVQALSDKRPCESDENLQPPPKRVSKSLF